MPILAERDPPALIDQAAQQSEGTTRPATRPGKGAAYALPSNRLLAEPSSKTSRIARLINGAMERHVSLSNCRSGGSEACS